MEQRKVAASPPFPSVRRLDRETILEDSEDEGTGCLTLVKTAVTFA